MNRRGIAGIYGVLLFAFLISNAYGQASTQRKSLSQRMADLRRGWTTSPEERAPAEQFPTPQTDGNSLIPNWLSGGDAKDAGQNPAEQQNPNLKQRPQSQTQRTNRGSQSQAKRMASPAGQNNHSPANPLSKGGTKFSLPGLGGAKLPTGDESVPKVRAGSNSSSNRRAATTRGADPNYPVIREASPQPNGTSTSVRGKTSQAQSSPRKSPVVNSQALRREFNGAFSATESNSEPQANSVAQEDEASVASDEPAQEASTSEEFSQPLQTLDEMSETESASPIAGEPTVEGDSSRSFVAPTLEPAGQSETETEVAVEAPGNSQSGGWPAFGAGEFIRSPRTNVEPPEPSAERSKEAFGQALQLAGGGDPSVLVSNQAPVITTDIRGPKQILVGREAVYRVRLQNQSAAKAEGLVATIHIPSSAEVVAATTTQGEVRPLTEAGVPTQLKWQLANLAARGNEVLDLRIIPRENKPLELGVTWTTAPMGSSAIVEVQEPKLAIEIGGPNEVMFDEPQIFKLTLSNPGTGPADNVRIDLVPPGGDRQTATSHTFGDLAPGDSKTIEIELTAREAGKLMMKALAVGEGGLTSEAAKEIFCRKPELEVDWRGPATKYAGTPAAYFFRVRNPGTAAAEDVSVAVTLPQGTEFISASDGQELDAKSGLVKWRVGTLKPGDDSYMELKCVVNSPGANEFKIIATSSSGNLSDSRIATTNVEAIADLKLSVADPSGPIAVGNEAIYEIQVKNRGSNTARNINVVGLFSEGIEPEQAEGALYTVADGRVSFRPIEELAAGQDIKLRIRARALRAGTHVFRAEVLCSDLEIKLAAEETTRFYTDEVSQDGEQAAEQTSSRQSFESAEPVGPRY